MKTRNFVAKHARTFNHARVFVDRKKAVKRGYVKHMGRLNAQVSTEGGAPADHVPHD